MSVSKLVFLKLKDEGGYLSNFWPSEVVYKDARYPTSEHAYQAQKYEDPVMRELIRKQPTPQMAAQLGRRGRDLREDWNNIRLEIMEEVLWHKFTQNENLGKLLVSTGELVLIEGMDRDSYWGWGSGPEHLGQNNLGKCLMATRERLKVEFTFTQRELF